MADEDLALRRRRALAHLARRRGERRRRALDAWLRRVAALPLSEAGEDAVRAFAGDDDAEALDARLRLQGYHPGIRCVVVGLGFAASYAIFCIFFCTREIQNLVYLLWLGGVLHQVVNRPRGVPVQWTRLLVTAAIPAINLFGQMVAR